jgi:hypothetical protein
VESRAAAHPVRLVDDRDLPLAEAVEACFRGGLGERCEAVAPGAALAPPPRFDSLRIEGTEHGPVTFRAPEVAAATTGGALRVTRKATVHVRGLDPASPATVSFFAAEDPEVRQATLRVAVKAAEGTFRVPAGTLVASVAQARLAPDLRVLDLAPGARAEVTFVARSGWSLLLRLTDADGGGPVPEARVDVRGMEGFAGPARPRETKSDAHGLAVVAGIEGSMVRAEVQHSRFVGRQESGLLAPFGTFLVHTVALERGGALRATLRLDGIPEPGLACRVVRYARNRRPGESPEVLASTTSDRAGLCATPPLEAGSYLLEISDAARGLEALATFAIAEGADTESTVELVPLRVTGTALLGSRPAAGFRVIAYSAEARIPAATRDDAVTEAVVDEEGEYELTVWSAGEYYLSLQTPQGVPAQSERRRLLWDEVVDFRLDEATVFGRVEDGEGLPLPGANVTLAWFAETIVHRLATTAEDGGFAFPMEGAGAVEVRAYREGYTPSEPLALRFAAGEPLGPLSLVLRKEGTLRGVVVGPFGDPLPGAQVVVASAAAARHRWRASSGADGRFEVVLPAGVAHQGFASGPGCPLTPFAVPAAGGAGRELLVACAAAPASLAVRILDGNGAPVPGGGLILATGGFVVPRDVLAGHLAALGLPAQSDAAGRLTVAGLAAGAYDLYLDTATNEDLVALGTGHGHLGSFAVPESTLLRVDARLAGDLPVVEAPPAARR